MKDKSTLIFIVIMVVIVAGLVIWGVSQGDESTSSSPTSDGAEISISPSKFDFNQVSQKNGVVNTSFTVENSGTADLIIDDMESSCMCTSAAIVVDGKEGPKFGMHNNPTNWSATIKPGESAELIVYYDPNVHQDFRGRATREVIISSNADNNSTEKVTINLTQVD
ncbi:MAG: DUF1573 domain-containing protein [bacterium]|nr:DUF1573 domain-containing protein [bacterium]